MVENQKGRSMIEMLGVLAIVGILSIGGIAGYSKAMTKHRINKWIEEMNFSLQSFIQYKKDWMKAATNSKDGLANVTKYMRDIGGIPTTWKLSTDTKLYDSLDSLVVFAAYPNRIFFNTNIKTDRVAFGQVCLQYWVNIIIPSSDYIYYTHMYETDKESGGWNSSNEYMGNAYCRAGVKCIKDLSISDIIEKCSKMEKNESVSMSIYFK